MGGPAHPPGPPTVSDHVPVSVVAALDYICEAMPPCPQGPRALHGAMDRVLTRAPHAPHNAPRALLWTPRGGTPFAIASKRCTIQPASRLQAPAVQPRGGRLQAVVMRHPPSYLPKLAGGGGGGGAVGAGGGDGRRLGGRVLAAQGGGGCTRPTTGTTTCMPQGVCVCLGAWGYRGMYAMVAISHLCQEESLKGLSTPRN